MDQYPAYMGTLHIGNPAIFVLEAPGTTPAGSRKYRCMGCTRFWRVSDGAYETIHQLRRDHRMYIVICHGCFQVLSPLLPPEMSAGWRRTDLSDARSLLGYQR